MDHGDDQTAGSKPSDLPRRMPDVRTYCDDDVVRSADEPQGSNSYVLSDSKSRPKFAQFRGTAAASFSEPAPWTFRYFSVPVATWQLVRSRSSLLRHNWPHPDQTCPCSLSCGGWLANRKLQFDNSNGKLCCPTDNCILGSWYIQSTQILAVTTSGDFHWTSSSRSHTTTDCIANKTQRTVNK